SRILFNLGTLFVNQGMWKESRDAFNNAKILCDKLKSREARERRVDSILAIGDVISNTGNFNDAIKIFQDGRKEAERIKYGKGIGVADSLTGRCLLFTGKAEEGLEYLLSAQKKIVKLKEYKELTRILLNIGVNYMHRGIIPMAEKYFKDLLIIAKKINHHHAICAGYGSLGTISIQQMRFKTAVNYFNKVRKIAEKIGDKRSLLLINLNLGNMYSNKGKFDAVAKHIKRGIYLAKEIGDTKNYNILLNNLVVNHMARREYSESIRISNELIQELEKTGAIFNLTYAYSNLGESYLETGKMKDALRCFNKQVEIAKENNYFEALSLAYIHLGKYWHYMNNQKKSLYYYRESVKISEKGNTKFILLQALHGMVRELIEMKQYDEAERNYFEAIKIQKVVKNPQYGFLFKVIEMKLSIIKRKKNSEKLFLKFIEKKKSNYGELFYELFTVIPKAEYKKKALEYLKKEYSKDSITSIKYMIDNLKK
ncbi:MAG: tetratricopeptide repeat protein, partial [bacterium]|nr:tetratricopeptide repeat protein [bacterium]